MNDQVALLTAALQQAIAALEAATAAQAPRIAEPAPQPTPAVAPAPLPAAPDYYIEMATQSAPQYPQAQYVPQPQFVPQPRIDRAAQAAANKVPVLNPCPRCQGHGAVDTPRDNGKCYGCVGKGWMNQSDVDRQKRYYG